MIANVPLHVGLIMDGNGRWAKKRLQPRSLGHKAGMDNIIPLSLKAKELGVKYLTLYVLSTENLKRPAAEIEGLFNLIRKYFKDDAERLYSYGAALKIIGDLSTLPEDVRSVLIECEKKSPEAAEFTLTFAINYGSRSEILNAVNAAVTGGKVLDQAGFENLLYTGGLPDIDLIIRTGGEKRLSNFLTYQAAYAELYFTDMLFPDFKEKEFENAIKDYSKRERRFGNI